MPFDGWFEEPPVQTRPAVTGWWATTQRGISINAEGSFGFDVLTRYPRELDLVVNAAIAANASQIEARALALGVDSAVLIDGIARQLTDFAVSSSVGVDMEAATTWWADVYLMADIIMTALERYPTAFGVDVAMAAAFTAIERQLTGLDIGAAMSAAFSATQADPRGLPYAATGDAAFDAIARQLTGYSFNAAMNMSATAVFPSMSAVTQTITSLTPQGVTIPYWARYIDVIAVGGGKGGTSGWLFGTGDGGTRGYNETKRWERPANGNEWTNLAVTVGAGGTAGGGVCRPSAVWRVGLSRRADRPISGSGGPAGTAGRAGAGTGGELHFPAAPTGIIGTGGNPAAEYDDGSGIQHRPGGGDC